MSHFNRVQLQDQYGFPVENTPMDEIRSVTPIRLTGATFVGTTVDPNFWTSAVLNGGTVTQANSQVRLRTNSGSADGSATLTTVAVARYTGGSSNRFRAQVQLGDTGAADNVRRWGCFDANNGAFFELNGTTMYAVTRKTGADTPVDSSAWNGSTTVPTLTDVNTYEIYFTNSKVYFVIAGTLVHTMSAATDTWTDTTNLPVRLENVNSGGSITDVSLYCRVATIYRLGELHTAPRYFHGTTAATNVLKYGAGILHRIVLNNPGGTLITVYDNTAGSGTVVAVINTPATANPVTLEYGLSFFTGLTVVTTGTWDVTIIYE